MAGADFNHFPAIADMLLEATRDVVARTADDGVGHVKDHIVANGQVKTGAMLNSVTSNITDDGTTATVDVGVPYAAYPNYGTRFQPAKPFFEPGVEETRADFADNIAEMAHRIEGAAG